MGARRFGPDVARFLQPDLFLGSLANLGLSTDPLTGNRYALAAGNPLSFLERDGHMLINDGYGGSEGPTQRWASEHRVGLVLASPNRAKEADTQALASHPSCPPHSATTWKDWMQLSPPQ
jgi:hypothetical protein